MKIPFRHTFRQLITLFLSLVFSFWFGRLSVQYQIQGDLPPLQTVSEINPKIPLVTIEEIRGGKLLGNVNRSEMRIVSNGKVAVPDEDLHFELDLQHLGFLGERRQVIVHHVPEWAHFVASKNGKYFYEVNEKSGKNLSVPTRLYFATEEAAEKAGYVKRIR